jgi:hypothetical protein
LSATRLVQHVVGDRDADFSRAAADLTHHQLVEHLLLDDACGGSARRSRLPCCLRSDATTMSSGLELALSDAVLDDRGAPSRTRPWFPVLAARAEVAMSAALETTQKNATVARLMFMAR